MAGAMIALSSTGEVLAAMTRARAVAVEAYTLHGAVLRATADAARRGARVTVRLAAPPRDGRLAGENARVAAELRRAGAAVALQQDLHAKEIRLDGDLYLDGKNWNRGDVVLRDSDPHDATPVAATKRDALAAEAQLLRGARPGDAVVVESESFGCCNGVYGALRALGRAGAAPRLIVNERDLDGNDRERRAIAGLVRDGVRVRVGNDSEKLAAAGNRAWLGSANATVAVKKWDSIDWGLRTADAKIAGTVRRRLEADWQAARDVRTSAPKVRQGAGGDIIRAAGEEVDRPLPVHAARSAALRYARPNSPSLQRAVPSR